MRSYLQDMAYDGEGDTFLLRKLRETPKHQFLTYLMCVNMWEKDNIISFEDAVAVPPIFMKIEELLLPYKHILLSNNDYDIPLLHEVLLKFEKGGVFADDYMEPKDEDLAISMMHLFVKTVSDPTIT